MYSVPGCVVERLFIEATRSTVVRVRATSDEARCPTCHTVSRAPHGTYTRRPADLPSLGRRLRLEIVVRRFYCAETSCARRTFAERLPGVLDVRARPTRRLAAAQRAVAIEVGAEAGARLTEQLAMPERRDRAFPKTTAERQRSAASAARRRVVYDEVRRRHAAGEPVMRINRTLGIAHGTVRKYAHAAEFPERAPHRRERSMLDPYLSHLLARRAAGCENSEQLWHEIRRLGYAGTQKQVRR